MTVESGPSKQRGAEEEYYKDDRKEESNIRNIGNQYKNASMLGSTSGSLFKSLQSSGQSPTRYIIPSIPQSLYTNLNLKKHK